MLTDKDLQEMEANTAIINEKKFVEICAEVVADIVANMGKEGLILGLLQAEFVSKVSMKIFHPNTEEKE